MGKFKELTRKLLKVSRDQVEAERLRQDQEKQERKSSMTDS
jgi:hypothetical protein